MISTRESENFPYKIGDKFAVISLNVGDKISIEPKISDLGLSRKINEPTANKKISKIVYAQLQEWEIILSKEQNELNEEQIQIRNQFLDADKIISSLSNISQKHQDVVDICQSISEPEISEISEPIDITAPEILDLEIK
ncbi:23840_t:CDS:2 [Gigaspora margarita]|uniref:23840_t:CDS:1 n=1 Tax=Gigaspora margarita TaxID=4874 RepID=A0ABN7W216_GIGMA|nr:23840_t:CDS:2 [Gigaspora margarita]